MNNMIGYGGPSRMRLGLNPRMSTPMMGTPNMAQPNPIHQQIAQQMAPQMPAQPQAQWGLQRTPTRGTY